MFSKNIAMISVMIAILSSAITSPVSSVDSSSCPIAFITITPTITSSILSTISSTSTSLQNSLQGASSSVSNSASSSSSSSFSFTGTLQPNDCHEDNCLRQSIKAPEIPSFCATYTKTINTITASLPDYVSMCDANPSGISSACSCLTTTGSSNPTPTLMDCQQNNCLRQFMNPTNTQITPFCYAYTTTTNTASADLPDFVSMCDGEPSQISSACSCVATPIVTSSSTIITSAFSSSAWSLSFISSSRSSLGSTTASGVSASTSVLLSTSSGDSTSKAAGVLTSLSSTSSISSTNFCPSNSVVTHTTTTTIVITITTDHLPSSVSSMTTS